MVFEAVRTVTALMRGFERPWFVAGGWALDWHLQRETRTHEDIEIGIFRRDQEALFQFLSGWEFQFVIFDGGARWPLRGEWLAPPIHELHGKRQGGGLVELEVLLDEAWADTWRFRRNLAVMMPTADVILRADDVPYFAPEIVLLYKAKHARARDEEDFRNALPHLDAKRRRWLREALEKCHPGHAWIASLSAPSRESS